MQSVDRCYPQSHCIAAVAAQGNQVVHVGVNKCCCCLLPQASTFSYGSLAVHVREGALGDGLGAKVWAVCHIMVRWVSGPGVNAASSRAKSRVLQDRVGWFFRAEDGTLALVLLISASA